MRRRYRAAYPDGFTAPEGCVLRESMGVVLLVGRHFALVPAYSEHPAGDALFIGGYQVDHVPTGRRVYRGRWGVAGEEACRGFIGSLLSMPVDWSSESYDGIIAAGGPEAGRFVAKATQWADAFATNPRGDPMEHCGPPPRWGDVPDGGPR